MPLADHSVAEEENCIGKFWADKRQLAEAVCVHLRWMVDGGEVELDGDTAAALAAYESVSAGAGLHPGGTPK